METQELSQVMHYEIYLQDLTHPYLEIELLGIAYTLQEAQTSVKLFKEALLTANSRKVEGRNWDRCTVLFRPVLKEKSA
jgi:hypothetical protein